MTKLQQLEEESILEAKTTVIFYGSAQDAWVREKRRRVQNVWAKQPLADGRRRAVYLARPEDDLKQAQYLRVPNRMLREADRFAPLLILGVAGRSTRRSWRRCDRGFAVSIPTAAGVLPFSGLRPFLETESSPLLRPRRADAEFLRRLEHGRHLAVLGTSGSGNSSLVYAGLVPALRGDCFLNARSRWRIVAFRPKGNPLAIWRRRWQMPELHGCGRAELHEELDDAREVDHGEHHREAVERRPPISS